MSTHNVCFGGEIRKKIDLSNEYPQHMFKWRIRLKKNFLMRTYNIWYGGEKKKKRTNNRPFNKYPQHAFWWWTKIK